MTSASLLPQAGTKRKWYILLCTLVGACGSPGADQGTAGGPGAESGSSNIGGAQDNPGNAGGANATGDSSGAANSPSPLPIGSVPNAESAGPCVDALPLKMPYDWTYATRETQATIEPGGEYLGCDRMAVSPPPSARNTFLRAFHSNVDKGTHHEVLLYDSAQIAQSRTCSGDSSTPLWKGADAISGGIDFATTAAKNLVQLATGVGAYDWSLPERYGIFLDNTGDGSWVSNHHYLNLTSNPVAVDASFEFHVIDSVQYPLGRIFAGAGQSAISVPAMTVGTTTGTLIAPFDLEIVVVGSHMHEHGTKFEQFFFDGSKTYEIPFYTSTTWDSPRVTVVAPIHLKKGQGITYRCTYNNFEAHTLVHIPGGLLEGTKGYEMCSVWDYYSYPLGLGYTGQLPPVLSGDIPADGASTALAFDPALEGANEAAANQACRSTK